MIPIASLEYQNVLEILANFASFSLSKELILKLTPYDKKLVIQRENARTASAMTVERLYGMCPMMGMSDIRLALHQSVRDQILSIPDLMDIARFNRGIMLIQKFFKDAQCEKEALMDLVNGLESYPSLAESIEKCFNGAYEVLDSASPKLKDIRRHLRLAQTKLQDTATSFIQKNASSLSEPISMIRNDRVVVLAKNSEKHSFKGMIHGESASGQSAYVEPPVLVELNNALAKLLIDQEEEIKRICFELSQKIKPYADSMEAHLETASVIDALFAKARYGNSTFGIVAQLSDDLYLKDARHPLIDPQKVVANTYRLDEKERVLLITGPNTGGKTVSLKIIGLFCLMAYSGIPVLCDEARLPLFGQIFVDIGDDQSIAHSLSTFSAHLSKLSLVTDKADEHSLALLDELGGGTDPIEGECLAMAVLNDLRKAKAWVVATTHYARLKEYGLQHDDIIVASMAFDMKSIAPTYKFIEGLPGQSYAFEIARRFGIKSSVIDEAVEYKAQAKTLQALLTEKLQAAIEENRKITETLSLKENELNQSLAEIKAKEEALEKTKQARLAQIEDEAQDYLNLVQEEAETILFDMRNSKTAPIHENISRKKDIDALIKEKVEETALDKVKIGQWVKITITNQVGQVVATRKQLATVSVNGVKLEVPLTKLAFAPTPIIPKNVQLHTERLASVPLEINLIGLTVDEALNEVDHYLDDCIRARMPFARLIHGHGTGALRSAIHSMLKGHHFVESYRLGQQSEGGVGATVVYFKGSKNESQR
ncbi:MAG: endonuclease MutS2 [Erysipelotrichaceae bacterium]|nr:endonuclease MutS2 [Erysipelotrichaceae bacterium]